MELLQPQEIEVFYILPAIRSGFAKHMKNSGISQKEIAKKLHVKESTISQYISNKRGDIKFNDVVDKAVSKAVKKIHNKDSLIRETQFILNLAKKENILCQIHKKLGAVQKDCNACEIKELIQVKW